MRIVQRGGGWGYYSEIYTLFGGLYMWLQEIDKGMKI